MIENQDIYDHALALLSLSPQPYDNEDLAERAPYHLAAFCLEAEDVNRWLSPASTPSFHPTYLPLEDEFPLCDRLAPVAALYLASMLILDEDPDRSAILYDRYADAMSDVHHGIPATLESIKELYI